MLGHLRHGASQSGLSRSYPGCIRADVPDDSQGFEFKSGACVKATQGPKHAQRDLSGHDHHAHYERRMFWNDDAHALGMAGPSASKTHRPSASATWGPSKTHGPSARPVMPPPHDDDSDMMDDGELDDVLQKRDHLYQARPSPSMSKTHVGPSPSPMPSGSLGRPVHGRKEDDGSLDLELWKRLFEQNFFGNTCTAAERQCPTEDGSEETQVRPPITLRSHSLLSR